MHDPLKTIGALILGLGLGGCSESEPTQAGTSLHIKLVDDSGAQLTVRADDFEERLVLQADFASGVEDWSTIVDALNPAGGDASLLSIEAGEEGGQSFVRLSGKQGAIYRVMEVQPSTVYAFQCLVRAHDIVPAGDAFFGAAPYLAELSAFGPVEDLLARGMDGLILSRELFLTTYRETGWKVQKRVFRTGPQTRALLVGCALGLTEPLASGSVDFTNVELRKVSSRRLQEDRLAVAVGKYGQGEPALQGWHAKRRIKALVGTELRPSLLLFPGESLEFSVQLPAHKPVLEFGVGAWRMALKDLKDMGMDGVQHFKVHVDGEELESADLALVFDLADCRWADRSLDLGAWAGQRVQLVLSVEGDLPGVFGAPQIREAELLESEPARPNLLLVSIDTLRADHVSSYGYEEETTPRLDALAAESIRYASVVSQSPYTLPSHTSMFSGQFPSVHGIQRGGQVVSSTRSPILARILSERGYHTRAYTGGGFMSEGFGFDKGFDAFINIDPLRQRDSLYLLNMGKNDPERYSKALIEENGPAGIKQWLSDNGQHPFFLFLHTYTVHDYDPPADFARCAERGCTHPAKDWHDFRLRPATGWNKFPYTAEDRAHLNHTYDDSLRYVDHLLGDIFDHLESLGLKDNTIVAVTSDHGEELLERGFVQHGKSLYEEVTRIPMILHIPGLAARVDERPVMQTDLMPTLLVAMGIPIDPRSQGIDLLAPAVGERVLWSEIHDHLAHRYAARSQEGLKLIHNPLDEEIIFPNSVEWELYDLKQDAAELDNLAQPGFGPFEAMRLRLENQQKALAILAESMGGVGQGEIDEDTKAQLRALGYF